MHYYIKISVRNVIYLQYAILSLIVKFRVIIQVYIFHELKIALILVNMNDHSILLWSRKVPYAILEIFIKSCVFFSNASFKFTSTIFTQLLVKRSNL